MDRYTPKEIEKKWQERWLAEKVFAAHDDSPKPKYYQLETFPYPSGAGLHVGHPKGYIAEDIHARFVRMGGLGGTPREVLYTMGWDAFGLPTENYALKVGKTPQQVTLENTDHFREQVRMFGFSYDWDREVNTSSPEYYRWTQWIFLRLFKKGLAYRAKAKVNWCPKDQTVLANEQVVNGTCEQCGSVIEERFMEQWMLRITDYAERLLSGLKGLDWPAATIKRQEDWIGKSEGAELSFPLVFQADSKAHEWRDADGKPAALTVFTTRPDTLFGATYLVLAPEHPWITLALDADHTILQNKEEVKAYVEAASHKTDLMRQENAKDKTGVELKGVRAVNPATKEEIPIWVADYVLGGYGTGAIMAVPAHDERDAEFAQKFDLPVRVVVDAEKGALINSGAFDGMDSQTAKWEIVNAVGGTRKTQYKLRDWSVSRQRYWGVPIPIIHCPKDGPVPVPDEDLPVLLPELKEWRPKGTAPLASSPEYMNVKCPVCGGDAMRDPETFDTFVDSSWYFLRYADPHNAAAIFDPAKVAHWMPVDLYVIGAEHTVLHLLYSRFFTKFLHDEGLLGFDEPFLRLRHQGLIRGADGQKMSKSRGNVVNPDELIGEYGADTLRVYEMFMGPFEDGAPWDPKGIMGANRFLSRAWNYVLGSLDGAPSKNEASNDALPALHRAIKKVTEDIPAFKFNTAISALMILLNELEKAKPLTGEDIGSFVKLLHPFAPHMAQELWARLGKGTYLDFEPWPSFESALIAEEEATIVLQVNGKVRDTVRVAKGMDEAAAREMAFANEKVKAALASAAGGGAEAAQAKRVVWVADKLVNIVI